MHVCVCVLTLLAHAMPPGECRGVGWRRSGGVRDGPHTHAHSQRALREEIKEELAQIQSLLEKAQLIAGVHASTHTQHARTHAFTCART